LKAAQAVAAFATTFDAICSEVEKVMVELRPVIEDVVVALLAEGNVLLEGVPGIGKTYLVKTLGQVLNIRFRRVQFTADLMPSDILGTSLLVQDEHGKRLAFQPGPLFTHLLLADEINRATPKTQAALLEAMEEHSVTIGGVTTRLEEPFFILATENPIEQDGTYPLPKAQLDKFLFKLLVGYPSEKGLVEIVMRTTFERYPEATQAASGQDIIRMRQLVRQVPVASHVEDFALRLVRATQPDSPHATETTRRYVESGSGPRGLLAILHGAKARALSHGNPFVSRDDIRSVALHALRHRIQRNLDAEAEDLTADDILHRVTEELREA
jgi:MoxR-like ATPase